MSRLNTGLTAFVFLFVLPRGSPLACDEAVIRLMKPPVSHRLEQRTHNPLVPGSNPGGPTNSFYPLIFQSVDPPVFAPSSNLRTKLPGPAPRRVFASPELRERTNLES